MQHRIRILFLSLLAALCLGFTSCSDKDEEPGGGTAKDYEYNDYYTALLRQAWKITEHEYADKSYYTKDFETSWVINEPFNYEGTEYCPFNYKLSLQSEINYVESVEVGTFADGEDWIVDLGTGRRLFAIESLTFGGNYYVMILRDTAGNRFRCHSVDGPCILFVENATDRALAAQYVRTFEYTDNGNSTATVDELGYTIKSLPANTIGAYDYGVDIKFTASNGNSKLLTCTNLRSGWNRGEISGDFSTSEEPDEPETPEYDTEIEEALFGTWLSGDSSASFFNYYNLEGTYVFDYRIFSYSRFISSFDSTRIRVKNEADGTKWAVDESGSIRFFEIRNFKTNSAMEIRLDGQNEWTLLYCHSDKARVFFIENGSSYEMLEVTYYSVSGGITETIYPDSYYVAMQGYHYQGMLGINGWIFPETYTVKATVKAYRSSASSTPDAEFEYTAEAPSDSKFTRAIITDADIPYKPNAEDVAKLEALLWQDGRATAWRIEGRASSEGAEFKPLRSEYGWLITEHKQGLHIGGLEYDVENGFKLRCEDGNFRLKIEGEKLYFVDWEGTKLKLEILTPMREILNEKYMDIRIVGQDIVYHCIYSNNPLILYAVRQDNITDYRIVSRYEITEKRANGSTITKRTLTGIYFNYKVSDATPVSAWCLAADEVTNPDDGVFEVKMYLNGENTPHLTYQNLYLGRTAKFTIVK